jgi:hypothetical protein
MPRPRGWEIGLFKPTGLPLLINSPLSSIRSRKVFCRRGEAIIHVIAATDPRQDRDDTLDNWADSDQSGAIRKSCTVQRFTVTPETKISQAIIVSCDMRMPGGPLQHTVNVYWEFRGKRFATYLEYAARDVHAPEYRRALELIMKGIRPI